MSNSASYWGINETDFEQLSSVLNKLPKAFWNYFCIRFSYLKKEKCLEDANLFVVNINNEIEKNKLNLTLNDVEICNLAFKESRKCSQIISAYSEVQAEQTINLEASALNISPPKADTIKGIFSRFKNEKWWRKKLRKALGLKLELIAYQLNLINKNKNIYASNVCVNRRKAQKDRNRKILEKLEAENENGDTFTLQELSDKSTSNPINRRNELMTRIAGNEKVADDLGHVGLFLTLTCPSRMHSSLSKACKPNPKFDGTSPKEANKYLTKIWAHMRTALNNRNIPFYGIRVVEPHHDGTPHWHFLLFVDKKDKDIFLSIFKHHALKTDGEEKGADKYRIKVENIDKSRGSATGYIAKYISKNIDGHGLDKDLYNQDAKNSAVRIESWASLWGIRQFQFFGNPPVTIWRELRLLKGNVNPDIQEAFNSANEGDWANFIMLMGGPCSDKKIIPITVLREWSDELNDYDEPMGYRIIGVEFESRFEISRVHEWKITYKKEELAFALPWSSVNNCTVEY